jgi:hypothetical protein
MDEQLVASHPHLSPDCPNHWCGDVVYFSNGMESSKKEMSKEEHESHHW